MSAYNAIHRVLSQPAYSEGMDDAVVDLVVIQWIMQKLRCDRMRDTNELAMRRSNLDEAA